MFRVKHLAALTLATLVPLAPVAQAQPWDLVAPSCTPVHVVQAAGTGFSHSWDPSARESLSLIHI